MVVGYRLPHWKEDVLKSGTMPAATVDHSQRICEVWANNLDEELKRIRHVIRKYNYIAMDTEFPGVVARPIGEFRSNAGYQYQLLRCNVDLLKIIQLGLTFMNEEGEYPPGTSTWQFNFRFNLTEDMYAQDSIELLTTSGIQFKKHEDEGIDTLYFAELLMTSGVVLCEGVKWLSFHRCSLRIISTTLNTVVTCTAWALALLTFRTEQAMLTKKRPTNSSHDITSEPLPLSPPTPLLSLDNGSSPLQSERNTIATGSFWKLKSRLILEPLSPPMLSSL
ncbi:CCR4-NOT transcription complex subunit 7 isoform X3 [Gadus macrocephalus]|uniref:CCR4-NOT transcription complex subunit 7 isoform X3 n=1 Tax=Gadus macrocephalus TaxID=80720 RepID=UPI0028CB5D2F|nr:CCR4-NOT transcription complex subunit 7 isoform X3 [Gadus macrocephalus]